MKIKDLRDKALKKANDLEAAATAENRNCLLMPIYQACLQTVKICDDLGKRTDPDSERIADGLAAKIGVSRSF